ncbi:MAG TPA: rod shape-determining protein RodA [Solirubrobacterales bacterium]|jgi:rod shape determining protein RodA|nr:rod shape-determining protein RodA [Solirubrobacterales bacterium]
MEAARPLTLPGRRTAVGARFNLAYFDGVMMAAALGLIAFSIFTLAAATADDIPGSPLYFVLRQGIYALIGLVLMFAVARVDYSRFRELRVGIYSIMIASICLVLVFGAAARGSRRWIELPYFRFQPSELAKLLLIVALAAFVIEHRRRGGDWRSTVRILAIGLAPAALVFLQPDLGTALVIGVITLAILLLSGVPWKHFAAIGGAMAAIAAIALVLAPVAGMPILKDYQQERLTSFLNPSDDPTDSSYQLRQSQIAIGAGEKSGRGEQASQTELNFLPEHHTDFIFAVIGERYGFMGAAFVLSLYALLVWRALRLLTFSKNLYGTLIAGGIAAMLMFQVFLNVGMNLGIMPVTGITLPLMSYGGSSVLVTFMAIGLLQSIHVQAQLASRDSRAPNPLLR